MFSLFLCLLTLNQVRDNPIWSHDGTQSVAAWRVSGDRVFLYRFGFSHGPDGDLRDIVLVISQNERPGQEPEWRSEQFVFTRVLDQGDRRDHWTGHFICTRDIGGRQIPLIDADLRSGYHPTPGSDGDAFLSGTIHYFPGNQFDISDKQIFKGILFSFPSRNP